MSDEPLLHVHDLRVAFGGLKAVDGATVSVERGSITALIGPNGAGKTTFFNAVTGFAPSSGEVIFDGRSIGRLPAWARSRRGLVRTFQIPRAFARLSVLDNMLLASTDQPAQKLSGAVVPGLRRRAAKRNRERALELLDQFGLAAKADDYAGELSGGQRKLLEFARALMPGPTLLLLDEPLAGVNPALGQELMQHMQRLRAEQGLSFLFIEHDIAAVMQNADRVIVMAQGKVIATGAPQEISGDARVLDAYLGSSDATLPSPSPKPEGRATPVLRAQDLTAGYIPDVDVLHGVDLLLGSGEVVGIIGPNGAGKSTLIKAMFGLVPVRHGAVLLGGRDVTGVRPSQLVRAGVAYVPQRQNVFPTLTVRENLELGGLNDRQAISTRIEEMFTLFPRLRERHRQAAGTLSGGERQMVAFARALMSNPKVLLLDEPSAGLAPQIVDEVFATVRQICDERSVDVLLVEQNARKALTISDRGYVLDMGRNAHSGSGSELLNDPKVGQLYLGSLAD